MPHIYRIFLNEKVQAYEFSQTYSFQRISGIRLELSPGHACVTIPMNAEKTQEDFLDFSAYVFRDAFRKAMQVHIILFGRDLFMESVSFEIDGKACRYTSKNAAGFPFVFSMLRGRKIRLAPAKAWKALIGEILETPKSRQDEDLRFSAVFAYWAGLSRSYELDRFQNFWMAMNAYYSYFGGVYNERLKRDDGVNVQIAGWKEEKGIEREIRKKDLKPKSENDRIRFLACRLTGRGEHFSGGKLEALDYAVERQLRSLRDGDLKALYEAARPGAGEMPARFKELEALAEGLGTDLFCLLLLFLPYHYRNAFFHGNKSLCLFMGVNDYEYSVLRAVNLFLDRFLGAAIPGMFSGEMLTDEAYERLKRCAFDGVIGDGSL